MTERDAPEKMPATIGRYQVQESIGFGAMGAVYKAFDPLIKRTLAIKTIRLDIPKQSAQYQTFIERFYHEARISGTLSHPNIVTLFDIGEEHGIPYLAMEYVPGDTVSALLEKGTRFAGERVLAILDQVASAVDYAHGRGVVHRDIKPSNIILHDGDKVKVTDFGIAKLANADLTQSGTLLGTPSYMSPEQAMGEKVDGRSDIFSLGVVAFEMLAGQQPFPGSNVTAILYKLVHDEPVMPSDLGTNGLVPEKWRQVFAKALAKKPVDRYATAGAFVGDLEGCLASAVVSESDATAASLPPAPATMVTTAAVSEAGSEAARTILKPQDQVAPVIPGPVIEIRGEGGAAPTEAPGAVAKRKATKAPRVAKPTAMATPDDKTMVAAVPGRPSAPDDKTVVATAKAAAAGAASAAAPARPAAPWRSLWPLLLLGAGAVVVVGLLGLLFARRTTIPEPTPSPAVEAAVPTPAPAAPIVSGTLRIESEPAGAAILLDGAPKGNTPLEVADVPLGEHTVKLDLRGFESQSQKVALTAEAPAGQWKAQLVRRAPAMATLNIASEPPDADVTIDGGIVGRTPILDMRLRPGTMRIDIYRPGYQPYSTTVRVDAGKKANVDAVLRPVTAAQSATAPAAPGQVRPPQPAGVFSDKEVDRRPARIAGQTASYPSKLPHLRNGQAVSVTVSFIVNESGEVTDLRVTESGGTILDEEVLNAVRGFRYTPGQKNGRPVKVRTTFRQTFRGA